MTFDFLERSNYDGIPVSLYEFNIGENWWRYSSDEQDTVYNGNIYKGTAISDTGVTQSGDAQSDSMTVTLPADEEIAAFFVATPPSDETWLTIRRMHHEDGDAPIIWIGTVDSARQVNLRALQFTCKLLTASFNRNGLRLTWGRQCHHALYDRNCRADKEKYAIVLQLSAINGNSIFSPSFAQLEPGWLNNGYVEFLVADKVLNRRAIEIQSEIGARLLGTTEGLKAGAWVRMYPGCNRTTDHCANKFRNLSNYGGFPHLPGKSPFDGDPVF